MSPNISLSIIICTRNRAASLKQTLNAMGNVMMPPGCKAEAIIVDNASTDHTAEVVRNTVLANMQIAYLFEPKRGKANALNSGLAKARGDILLFTDDDTAPSEDWIEQVLACFFRTGCDALVGKVKLAPDLERPWMQDLLKWFLAAVDFKCGETVELVGANCACRRRVLNRVSNFDPELGPGALGLGEDTLFGCQLLEAGFAMEYADSAVVVHYLDKSRLARRQWLHSAAQRGRSKAYVMYHWEHSDLTFSKIKSLWMKTKLGLRRLLQPPPPPDSEGCPPWEVSYVYHSALYGHYCIERRRSRNYVRRGLSKLAKKACEIEVRT